MDTLLKMSGGAQQGVVPAGTAEFDSVETTVKKLLRTLEGVTDYVEKVRPRGTLPGMGTCACAHGARETRYMRRTWRALHATRATDTRLRA